MYSKGFPRSLRSAGVLAAIIWGACLRTEAQGFKVIHQCVPAENFPNTLIQAPAPDGHFYGTTLGGGSAGKGSVFKMDAAGNVSTIHSFAGPPDDGSHPRAALFLNDDGFLYGTTYNGGPGDAGAIFRLDTSGGSYSVHGQPLPSGLCDPTGAAPLSSFMKASNGSLYVTMSSCGVIDQDGTIDVVDTSLNETPIASGFDTFNDQATAPWGRLVEGDDLLLYGAAEGNLFQQTSGAVYRIGQGGGAPEIVHAFALSEAIDIQAALMRASDGYFYGTSYESSASVGGLIFRVGEDKSSAIVHGFNIADGRHPISGLMQASDGYLYGVTNQGGIAELGTIYRLDTAGNFTLLARGGDVGISQPSTELLQGSDGKLYGATNYVGGVGAGVIYTIDLTQKIDSITPSSGPSAGGTSVTIAGSGFVAGAAVTIGDASATGVGVPDGAHITATTPANNPGTLQLVKVTLPDTTVIVLNKGWFSDFLDVPTGDLFHDYVRKMLSNGITAGCGGGNYCRNNPVTRAQMAVFLLKAEHGSSYVPPFCNGIFPDVTCTPGVGFPDWIEQLAGEGITTGCGGGNYCPTNPVTRQQMAVFLLKTEHGSAYTPPGCTGIFGDVMCPSQFADWIERLAAENVTGGCQISPPLYCPTNSVLRGQMAAFLTKAFNLP